MRRFGENPAAFRASMMIDADGGPVSFKADPWQDEDFLALDKVWQRATGHHKDNGPTRAYVGRSRGHSKTTDEALEIIWALAYAKRPIAGLAAAAARDQAQILRDRIQSLVMINSWLSDVLDIQNYKIYNIKKGAPAYNSSLEIISSDAPSSYGALVDFILCDEFTHWKNRDLWDSVLSSAAKRANCALIIMTNAGFMGTWQHDVFVAAGKSERWVFRNQHGPQASWITEDRLEEQRMLLPKKAYNRLWMNEWQVEAGDALELSDIEAAVAHDRPMTGNERDWTFVGGLDLSTKRHRSALVVLGANQAEQRVRLAYSRSWKPGPDGKVPLPEILAEVVRVSRQFGCVRILFDPHQAALLAQLAAREGVRMEELPFVGRNLDRMASTVLEVFKSRRIELYRDKQLIDDLCKLNIVEKKFGFKLEANEDQTGHADTAMAFAIALPAAVELSSMILVRPFTDSHVARLPSDLKARIAEIDAQAALQAEIDGVLTSGAIGNDGAALLGERLAPREKAPVEIEQEQFAAVMRENGIGDLNHEENPDECWFARGTA